MVVIVTKNSARGFVTAGNTKYTFEVFPAEESQRIGLVKVDWELKRLLGDSFSKFLTDDMFHDIYDFHDKLSEFVQEKLGETEDVKEDVKWLKNPLKICEFIKALKQEMETAGEYIKNFDIENETVTVEVTDSQLRTHKANLKFSQDHLVEPIHVLSYDLPLQRKHSTVFSHILSVSEFCQKFSELVTHFQGFWNAMNILDSQSYVLDPSNPTFKDVYRRIKLSDTLSIVLTLDPFLPREKPHMKLLGCYQDVNRYQDILQNNLLKDLWDPDEDLLYNLSTVLEISIPEKMMLDVPDVTELTEPGECAICFCWRLKDEIPSEVCENPSCRSTYHSTCLFKYLSSLPRNRDYFSKIQGECPNCDDAITCAVPKFIQ